MTLEEYIDYAEEQSEWMSKYAMIDIYKDKSEYYRQLAELLRELKKWRALRDRINMLCDVDCEYPQYRESGTMCNACPIGTVKEYFEQIFEKE